MFGKFLRSAKRLQLVFLALTILLASMVVVLGRRFATQDRQLFEKQLDDEREAAVGLAVIALEQRIASVERALTDILAESDKANPVTQPPNSVFFYFRPGLFRSWLADGLDYLPCVYAQDEAQQNLF